MVPEMASPWMEGKITGGGAQGPMGSNFLALAGCGGLTEICMDTVACAGGGQHRADASAEEGREQHPNNKRRREVPEEAPHPWWDVGLSPMRTDVSSSEPWCPSSSRCAQFPLQCGGSASFNHWLVQRHVVVREFSGLVELQQLWVEF